MRYSAPTSGLGPDAVHSCVGLPLRLHERRETQVTWRNGKNPGCAYEGMDYEAFRRFAKVASKGKYINSTLGGFGLRYLDPDEVNAPSNPQRRGVSRSRG